MVARLTSFGLDSNLLLTYYQAMIFTNLFTFVSFTLVQLVVGIFIVTWSFDIGMFFPIGVAGAIFIFNAVCGIISSLQD